VIGVFKAQWTVQDRAFLIVYHRCGSHNVRVVPSSIVSESCVIRNLNKVATYRHRTRHRTRRLNKLTNRTLETLCLNIIELLLSGHHAS